MNHYDKCTFRARRLSFLKAKPHIFKSEGEWHTDYIALPQPQPYRPSLGTLAWRFVDYMDAQEDR